MIVIIYNNLKSSIVDSAATRESSSFFAWIFWIPLRSGFPGWRSGVVNNHCSTMPIGRRLSPSQTLVESISWLDSREPVEPLAICMFSILLVVLIFIWTSSRNFIWKSCKLSSRRQAFWACKGIAERKDRKNNGRRKKTAGESGDFSAERYLWTTDSLARVL